MVRIVYADIAKMSGTNELYLPPERTRPPSAAFNAGNSPVSLIDDIELRNPRRHGGHRQDLPNIYNVIDRSK